MSNGTWRLATIFSAGLMIVTTIGCGGGNSPQPVSGKVTVGGKPVAKGAVRFTSTGTGTKVSGVGDLDSTGNYKLSSNAQGDGVPPGEYTVTFSGTEVGGGYDNPNQPSTPVLNKKYELDETTDQKFTVKSGSNTANFELSPP